MGTRQFLMAYSYTQLYHHYNGEGSGTVLTQTLPKACVWQGKPELMLCTIFFQSLASTVAEINRVPIFSDAPWPSPPPPILVLNVVFW